MRRKALHEPWRTFFEALDKELSSPCDLHCFGGFVLTEHYGVTRSNDRDREDVVALAQRPGLDTDVLRSRYRDELRPTLARPDREDLTLELWIEMISEISSRARRP